MSPGPQVGDTGQAGQPRAALPVTARTPQVGDVVMTVEELDALPQGTVVIDRGGDAAQRVSGDWYFPETAPLSSTVVRRYRPLTVIYIPGRKPRPERVVKAESLREMASLIYEDDALLYTAVIAGVLREQADRIEAGEVE